MSYARAKGLSADLRNVGERHGRSVRGLVATGYDERALKVVSMSLPEPGAAEAATTRTTTAGSAAKVSDVKLIEVKDIDARTTRINPA